MNGRRQCDQGGGCGKYYKQHLTSCPYCGASDAFSDFVPFNPLDWIFDLETYPNVFTASFKHVNTGTRAMFEASPRRNDLPELFSFLRALQHSGCRLVGFNNIGFDYPIIHFMMLNYYQDMTAADLYSKAASIIATPWAHRFSNIIWDKDRFIPQIDLYKIHHFDNEGRSTSLKMLEFNMQSPHIEDLPFPPGEPLTVDQIPELLIYNNVDVDETEKFYIESLEMIEFREQLGAKHGRNFLNHSDKKIGTDLFISELEKNIPGSCYINIDGKRSPRQTIRASINLGDVIFPYINFKNPEFARVKAWLSSQVITETKGIFKDLSATIDGFKYDFGLGGIHGSIDSATVCSDENYLIVDWDVSGYYPEVGTKNKLYPQHLSEQFCQVNEDLAEQRKQYKKGTALNNAIKLARNGAYGDSNNKYSPFYDPQYTMSITINGQLLLCLLAEHLIDIPGLQMIQINTDGLTVRCPRPYINQMHHICKWWQEFTCLELENVNYSRMFIRDVNNYIGEYEDGRLKNKGAYVYKTKHSQGANWTPNDMDWHQNHSALIVPKAAEAALVHGRDITEFITNHRDIMDFMLRTKVGRADRLEYYDAERSVAGSPLVLQRITRYYISKTGGALTKISPPAKGHKVGSWKRASGLTDQFYNGVIAELRTMKESGFARLCELDTDGLPWDERINTKNRSKYKIRSTSINAGHLVTPCNNIADAKWSDINFDYYIAEAEKLVKPLKNNI